jgi:GDP-L-fucose synthase
MADALCFLMENYESPEIINVGVGEDVSIAELAAIVGKTVGYGGRVVFDSSKPDGTPRKLLDVTRLHSLGWHAKIPLEGGIRSTYEWYIENEQAKAKDRA